MSKTERSENPRSEREGSDARTKPHDPQRVSSIEKVGGKTGIRFTVPNHPDKSVVRGPGGK